MVTRPFFFWGGVPTIWSSLLEVHILVRIIVSVLFGGYRRATRLGGDAQNPKGPRKNVQADV